MARLYSLHGSLSSEKHQQSREALLGVRGRLHPSHQRGQSGEARAPGRLYSCNTLLDRVSEDFEDVALALRQLIQKTPRCGARNGRKGNDLASQRAGSLDALIGLEQEGRRDRRARNLRRLEGDHQFEFRGLFHQ
jgi:hypothetical protein